MPPLHAEHLAASALPELDGHALVGTWSLQPGWLIAGVLILAAYGWAVRRAAHNGLPLPTWRVVSFVLGVVITELTLASAIDAYAMDLFWMHMVEHLVLIMVVPVFLVLGHPLTAFSNALRSARFDAILQSRAVGIVTAPLIGLLVYTVVIIGTHLTDFMDQMAMHSSVMTLEQILYVIAGCWLFMPLLAQEPLRSNSPYLLRIAVLFLAMVPDAVVGVVLLQTNDNLFPMMTAMRPAWAPDPVRDINTAGALMWAAGDGLMMFIAVGVVIAMISDPDQSRQGFGSWLEGARRRTMVQHVNLATGDGTSPESDFDPDGDEALAAYNRMLGRLGDGDHG